MSGSNVFRVLLMFGICIPIAIAAGYAVATPMTWNTLGIIGLLLMAFSIPMLMHGHHVLLIVSWNATVNVFFLPGQPALWMVVAIASLAFSIVRTAVDKKSPFIYVHSVAWPLILLLAVILVTAFLTGGIGARALGSDVHGGKRYAWAIGAIIGFFALSCQPIPPGRALLYSSVFFFSGVSAIASNLVYAMGPSFYFLYSLFPTELAIGQYRALEFARLTGAAWASLALYSFMLVRYGIRGIFDLAKPWRPAVLILALLTGLFGGFRSSIILYILIFATQFYFEGLLRTRFLPRMILASLLIIVLMIPVAHRLPLAFQRSLSFLPLDIDPVARRDAANTLDWRLLMWKTVLPDVPKHLLLGRGFSYSSTDFQLTREAMQRGHFKSYEDTLITGNYHNGWLTLVIPFGIWGLIAFFWFCWAGWKVLRANHRWGDPSLKSINTAILALFTARLVFFAIFYGQFDLDLFVFTGLVALSIALNHGVKSPPRAPLYQSESRAAVPAFQAE